MTIPLCIYHHACADGVAAAWAVREHYRLKGSDVEFFPGIYDEAPPDVTGRDVIMVDFSYKRPVLLQMAEQANSLLVIDHHKTAMQDIIDLPFSIDLEFSLNHSGAMLAWNRFHPGQDAPLLFDHIQDHDLWRFALSHTREITAAVYSHPITPTNFGDLINAGIRSLIAEGISLLRKQRHDIDAIIRDAVRQMRFGETLVPAANVPWMYASDVAGILAEGQPFAVTYYDDAKGRRFSLRSTPDGADVSTIAEAFGGGGHEHAAGFRMTREEAIDFEVAGGV
jgi:oligoribonuclease NrnB/cAMP/cGMP phosphodiesterase (DHH superfamily)